MAYALALLVRARAFVNPVKKGSLTMDNELLQELANKISTALMPRVIEDNFDLGYKAAIARVSMFLTEDLIE